MKRSVNEFRKEVGVAKAGHKVLDDFKLDFVHKTSNVFISNWNYQLELIQ
jgi:hypothetical protein